MLFSFISNAKLANNRYTKLKLELNICTKISRNINIRQDLKQIPPS